jgi:KDO2-lipid IV(A) lauroyltransferase
VIAYRFFQFFEFLLFLFPYSWRKRFFIALSRFAYAVDKSRRHTIRQNLRFAYRDTLDEAQVEEIGRACFKNLALNLMQIMEHHRFGPGNLEERITFNRPDIVKLARESKRPVIISTAHFGRWELSGNAISNLVSPLLVVYKELNNPYFDKYLVEARARVGIDTVEKHGAVKGLVNRLKTGQAVSLLIDTNLNRRDGVVVDFFGHSTRTTITPAYLARKYDALIIPTAIVTEDDEHFTVLFDDPIEVAHTDDADADIKAATQAQSTALEGFIREYPHLWFWCHRRWRTDHSHLYKKRKKKKIKE